MSKMGMLKLLGAALKDLLTFDLFFCRVLTLILSIEIDFTFWLLDKGSIPYISLYLWTGHRISFVIYIEDFVK